MSDPSPSSSPRPTPSPAAPADRSVLELCACPECGLPAEVVAGPTRSADELVGVRCIQRHWFYGLRDRLVG